MTLIIFSVILEWHTTFQLNCINPSTSSGKQRNLAGTLYAVLKLNTFGHKPHLYLSFSFRLNFTSAFERKLVIIFQQLVSRLADVHLANFARRFHAASGVHRIAPNVILKFLDAYNSSYYRPCMNAEMKACISSAANTEFFTESSVGTGKPPAAM